MTLIERIEAASATDHLELDAIDLAIAEWCYTGGAPGLVNYDPEMWLIRNGGWARSIDAALGLAERVRPRWGAWSVGQNVHSGMWFAYALAPGEERAAYQLTSGTARHPALALVAAILRAMEGEG